MNSHLKVALLSRKNSLIKYLNPLASTKKTRNKNRDKKNKDSISWPSARHSTHHPLVLCSSSGALQRPPPRTDFANSVLSVENSLSSMSYRIKSIVLYFTTSHLPSPGSTQLEAENGIDGKVFTSGVEITRSQVPLKQPTGAASTCRPCGWRQGHPPGCTGKQCR